MPVGQNTQGGNTRCGVGTCMALLAVALVIWQTVQYGVVHEEDVRELAAPPRWVTLQVDPPENVQEWDLCFGISDNDVFYGAECFDNDDAGQYWKFKLELGYHTLRFEGQTSIPGWSWKLHDGKVHEPVPDDAESYYQSAPDETTGVLAHFSYNDAPFPTDVVDVDFVLRAAGGFVVADGVALIGSAASFEEEHPSSGAFCSDLGYAHADDPYFWATTCPEATDPRGSSYWLPITAARCEVCSDPSVSSVGAHLNGTTRSKGAKSCGRDNLTAACAASCCSVCTGHCMVTPSFVPRITFWTIVAPVSLLCFGFCLHRCNPNDDEYPILCFIRSDIQHSVHEFCADCPFSRVCQGTICVLLLLVCFLYAMENARSDPTSPFWGEEDVTIMSLARLLAICILAICLVSYAAQLAACLRIDGCMSARQPARQPTPQTAPRPVMTSQAIAQLTVEQLHMELSKVQSEYRRLIEQPQNTNKHLQDSMNAKATISAIRTRLVQLGLREGIPPMAASQPSFAESAYQQAYDEAPRAETTSLEMLFNDVQELIRHYCQQHNCAPDQTELLAQDLNARLLAQYQDRIRTLPDSDKVARAAQLVWTSDLHLESGGVQLQQATLFQMLNDTIRNSGRRGNSTVPTGIGAAVRIARCINELCVKPSHPPGHYNAPDNTRRVFRGGGFDPRQKAFFDALNSQRTFDAERGAEKFRIPQYWATSLSEDVALRFMRSNSGVAHRGHGNSDLQSVLWTISMPADSLMWNAAQVESSHYQGEQEYLFVPFSTFVVLQVRWNMGTYEQPHRIDVLAMCDNRNESDYLQTAPWA